MLVDYRQIEKLLLFLLVTHFSTKNKPNTEIFQLYDTLVSIKNVAKLVVDKGNIFITSK